MNLSLNYVPRPHQLKSDFTIETLNTSVCIVVHRSPHISNMSDLGNSYLGCKLLWCQTHSSFKSFVVLVSDIRPFQFLECGPRFQNAWTERIHITSVS